MKYNYPIRYALMPIYRHDGFYSGFDSVEKDVTLAAYIVSKCYVVGEQKKYLMDGSVKLEYEVVFPYQKKEDWEKVYPITCLNDQCSNSTFVSNVYVDYEIALEVAQGYNLALLWQTIGNLAYDEEYEEKVKELQEKHNDLLQELKTLEIQIQSQTSEMDLKKFSKRQDIIMLSEECSKVLPISLYVFLAFYKDVPFSVYHVTEDQYYHCIEKIKKGQSMKQIDIFQSDPLLINDIENKKIQVLNNGILYGHLDVLNQLTWNQAVEFDFPNVLESCLHVYTIESYEDIIASYQLTNTIPKNIITTDGIKTLIKK